MGKFGIKKVFPLITAAIAAAFMYLGYFEVGFWDFAKGPLGGFYPTIIGFVLFAVSVFCFVQSLHDKAPRFPKEDLYVAGAAAAVILSSFLIGLFPSIFLFLFLWMKLEEKASWKSAALVTVSIGGTAWLVFSLWLKVPFPMGLFEQFL